MIQCARLAFGYVGIFDQDEAERIIIEKDITAEGETLKQEPKAPEPWPAEAFAAAIKKYGPTVTAGTKTSEALIAWMKAKNPLTAEQEAAVLALKPAAAPIEGEVMSEAEIEAIHAKELAEAER